MADAFRSCRLDKVVLANTAAHFPDPAGWNARIRAVRAAGMAALAPAIVTRWLSDDFRVARPETADQIEDMLRESDPRGYAACCAAMRDADLRDALRSAPPRPALVIVGDADASCPAGARRGVGGLAARRASGYAQGGAFILCRGGDGVSFRGDVVSGLARTLSAVRLMPVCQQRLKRARRHNLFEAIISSRRKLAEGLVFRAFP